RNVPLTVFPCAEVMAHPDITASWSAGHLLSVADAGRYLMLEMPRDHFVDLLPILVRLGRLGVRPILAHPERHPELLFEPGHIERWIEAGCLVQVSSGSVTDPPAHAEAGALKDWFQRGVVHMLGSDGHSLGQRPPRLRAAYRQIVRWSGIAAADRI